MGSAHSNFVPKIAYALRRKPRPMDAKNVHDHCQDQQRNTERGFTRNRILVLKMMDEMAKATTRELIEVTAEVAKAARHLPAR